MDYVGAGVDADANKNAGNQCSSMIGVSDGIASFNAIFGESDSQIKKNWRRIKALLDDEKLPKYLKASLVLDLPKRVTGGQPAAGRLRTMKHQRQSAASDISNRVIE